MVNPSPGIAILGAGIFVKTQYIPRLAEISDLVVLKAIWSRTEVTFFSFYHFWKSEVNYRDCDIYGNFGDCDFCYGLRNLQKELWR